MDYSFTDEQKQIVEAARKFASNEFPKVARECDREERFPMDEAIQLHGGYGYMDEYDDERFYRDAKVVEIYDGAKEIDKITIAREVLGRG